MNLERSKIEMPGYRTGFTLARESGKNRRGEER
jgi:hypothetical protein